MSNKKRKTRHLSPKGGLEYFSKKIEDIGLSDCYMFKINGISIPEIYDMITHGCQTTNEQNAHIIDTLMLLDTAPCRVLIGNERLYKISYPIYYYIDWYSRCIIYKYTTGRFETAMGILRDEIKLTCRTFRGVYDEAETINVAIADQQKKMNVNRELERLDQQKRMRMSKKLTL